MSECVRYLPEGTREPESPLEALLLAKAILQQEDRWARGEIYQNVDSHGFDARDSTPYCGNWKVCATGAVYAVTVGFGQTSYGAWLPMGEPLSSPNNQLYRATVDLLDACVPQEQKEDIFVDVKGAPHTDTVWMVDYNDYDENSLEDILAVFDAAIEKAKETV